MGVVVLLGSAAIWIVTPLVERWFLAGKYHLAGSLVLAAAGERRREGGQRLRQVGGLGAGHAARAGRRSTCVGWASVAIAIGAPWSARAGDWRA